MDHIGWIPLPLNLNFRFYGSVFLNRLPDRGTRVRDVDVVHLLRHQAAELWRAVHVGEQRDPINRPGKNALTRVRNKPDQVHQRKGLSHQLGRHYADTQHPLRLVGSSGIAMYRR